MDNVQLIVSDIETNVDLDFIREMCNECYDILYAFKNSQCKITNKHCLICLDIHFSFDYPIEIDDNPYNISCIDIVTNSISIEIDKYTNKKSVIFDLEHNGEIDLDCFDVDSIFKVYEILINNPNMKII